MDKKPLISLIFIMVFVSSLSALAQPDNPSASDSTPQKLLYIVDKADNDYLVPYIEQRLKNLRYANQDKKLYDSVVSLNILTKEKSIQSSVITTLINNRLMTSEDIGKKTKDSTTNYVRFMKQYESILLIKINLFNNSMIEYQFTLFEWEAKRNIFQYSTSSSVFVNPDKPHFQLDIIRTLNQVFAKASSKPVSNIAVNKIKNKTDNTYYVTVEDTLTLEPIIEDQSTEDDRLYFWSQDSANAEILPIEATKKNLVLKNLQPGNYSFYFKVTNGITYSKMDTVYVYSYAKPTIRVTPTSDRYLFTSSKDRLIIQEYILGYKHIDYFSKYVVKLDQFEFKAHYPGYYVKLCDKKGVNYVIRRFPFTVSNSGTLSFNGDTTRIIEDINNMENPLGAIGTNKYTLVFGATDQTYESKEVKRDLEVFQRRPISIVYDAMVGPLNAKNAFFSSWLNFGAGLDIRMNNIFFLTAIAGTNCSLQSFTHFYTNIIANLICPGNRLEGGPAIFLGSDDKTISLGFRTSYTIFQTGRSGVKLGFSYYNRGNSDFYAIHYIGNIFLNH